MTGNYIITEAKASWKKWVAGPDEVTEIDAPHKSNHSRRNRILILFSWMILHLVWDFVVIVENTPNSNISD